MFTGSEEGERGITKANNRVLESEVVSVGSRGTNLGKKASRLRLEGSGDGVAGGRERTRPGVVVGENLGQCTGRDQPVHQKLGFAPGAVEISRS